MKIKEMLLISLSIASLVACSNNTTNNEDRDAMKILEEKREYYEKIYFNIICFIFYWDICK